MKIKFTTEPWLIFTIVCIFFASLYPALDLISVEPPVGNNFKLDDLTRVEVITAPFLVKKRYKSMQGPMQVVSFTPQGIVDKGGLLELNITASEEKRNVRYNNKIEAGSVEDRELWWWVGAEIEVIDPADHTTISPEYMCHLNMDVDLKKRRKNFPKSPGSNVRLLTLTGGAMRFELPAGYAVPMASDEPLTLYFQVLNHNRDGEFQVKHRLTLFYVKDSLLSSPMEPLDFHVPFIAMPLSESGEVELVEDIKMCSCCAPLATGENAAANGSNGIYKGPQGRNYSGHWQVPKGESVVTFPLRYYASSFARYDTTIHALIPHVHPYATYMDIIKFDKECDLSSILYRSEIENRDGVTGIKNVVLYSSSEGIPVRNIDDYEIRLAHNNTSDTDQDAMGTMGIFTHDKKWSRPDWGSNIRKAAISKSEFLDELDVVISDELQTCGIVAPSEDAEDQYIKIETTLGDLVAELYTKWTPTHVGQILKLVEGGCYNNLEFHGIQSDYYAQIKNVEWKRGGLTPEQKELVKSIPLEAHMFKRHTFGSLSMARGEGKDSARSSFSIMLSNDAPHLDGEYTLFGQIIKGLDVLREIAMAQTNENYEPVPPITIKSIQIINSPEDSDGEIPDAPMLSLPDVVVDEVSPVSDEVLSKVKTIDEVIIQPADDGADDFLQITTSQGVIYAQLFSEKAPLHTEQIKKLVEAGCYNQLGIARIHRGFVAQVHEVERRKGGLTDEQKALLADIPLELNEFIHERGILTMAREDGKPNSARSSFSIMLGKAVHLDGKYTTFGKVVGDLTSIGNIESFATDDPYRPKKIIVEKIQILNRDEYLKTLKHDSGA